MLILGARAPSPAMSAKRETVTASRGLGLRVLRARAPALPVLTGSFQIGSTFWAKPLEFEKRKARAINISRLTARRLVRSKFHSYEHYKERSFTKARICPTNEGIRDLI